MTAARIVCDVPGCPNSSAKWAGCCGYLCSRHWRMVPKALKRRDRAVLRALTRRGDLMLTDKGNYRSVTQRGADVSLASWRSLSRAAIRMAAGL